MGQTDTVKKYNYEICVYFNPKERPAIINSEVKDITDTIVSIIKGRVYNYKKTPVPFALVSFENKKDSLKRGCVADSLGDFIIYLPPDNYELNVASIGYKSLTDDEFQTRSVEIRQIEIRLGSSSGFKTLSVSSDKPLSKKKLRRIERRFRRKA
jgi:hypothetical protein